MPSWRRNANIPTSHGSGSSADSIDGIIYVVGGWSAGFSLRQNSAYDPIANTWSASTLLPAARSSGAMCTVDGKLYFVGGSGSSNSTYEFSPLTQTWASKATIPAERINFAAGAIDGKIYAVGGGGQSSQSNANDEYNVQMNSWSSRANLPTERYGLVAGAIDGALYAAGGVGAGGATLTTGPNHRYTASTNTWASRSVMGNQWASGFGAGDIVMLNDKGYLHVVGGTRQFNTLNQHRVYDVDNDLWYTWPSMPTARSSMAAATVGNKIYIIGGSDSNGTATRVNEDYSEEHRTEHPVAVALTPVDGERTGLRPALEWSYFSELREPQVKYRVQVRRIFRDPLPQLVYDSGEITSSSQSHTPTIDLPPRPLAWTVRVFDALHSEGLSEDAEFMAIMHGESEALAILDAGIEGERDAPAFIITGAGESESAPASVNAGTIVEEPASSFIHAGSKGLQEANSVVHIGGTDLSRAGSALVDVKSTGHSAVATASVEAGQLGTDEAPSTLHLDAMRVTVPAPTIIVNGSFFEWIPDLSSIEESISFDTIITRFESGREQRHRRGVGRSGWSLRFRKGEVDANEIWDFYVNRGTVTPFLWMNPIDEKEYLVRFADQIFSAEAMWGALYGFGLRLVEVK